jgi:hypothetical protein
MKKILHICSISLIIISAGVHAQGESCRAHFDNTTCTDTVPADAQVVTGNEALTAVTDCFWVCSLSSLTLYAGSSNLNINMENVSVLNASGSEITIWAKLPNTINLDSCITVNLHIEEGVVVNVDASCTFVDIDTCESIIFNYAVAPGEGCIPTSVLYYPKPDGHLYPVPANEFVVLQIPGYANTIMNYRLIDMTGQLIRASTLSFDLSASAEINVSGLLPGLYVLTGEGLQNQIIAVK